MFYVYNGYNLFKVRTKKEVEELISIYSGYSIYITTKKLEMDKYLYKQTLKDLNISLKNWTKRNIFDDYIYKLKQLHNLI